MDQSRNKIEAVVAQGHDGVTVIRRLWVQSRIGGMNYYLLIFSHLRSSTNTVLHSELQFHHSTHNASKKSPESGERSVLTLGLLCLS